MDRALKQAEMVEGTLDDAGYVRPAVIEPPVAERVPERSLFRQHCDVPGWADNFLRPMVNEGQDVVTRVMDILDVQAGHFGVCNAASFQDEDVVLLATSRFASRPENKAVKEAFGVSRWQGLRMKSKIPEVARRYLEKACPNSLSEVNAA